MQAGPRYELYYWPGIQGRGEFVRLALEAAAAEYVDVARLPADQGGGVPALMKAMQDPSLGVPPFAPPFLKVDDLVIAQTANILQFLGPRLGLVPADEPSRLLAHQLQLTMADFASEAHDAHHPISVGLYYEQQKPEALRRTTAFVSERIPKFLGYFERVVERNEAGLCRRLIGRELVYVDLSMFQIWSGLQYAFPKAMAKHSGSYARLQELVRDVAETPRVAAYLASERRVPFNQHGLFRHYSELDLEPGAAPSP